jgi:hypothetical protein
MTSSVDGCFKRKNTKKERIFNIRLWIRPAQHEMCHYDYIGTINRLCYCAMQQVL